MGDLALRSVHSTQYATDVRLGHTKLVGDGLLNHASLTHVANPLHQFIAEFGSAMLLVSGVSRPAALNPISNVVGMGSVLKVFRVDALPVIACVAADLRPVSIPEKEGQAMRQDALLVTAKFTVACLVQTARPFPAAVIGDGGSGFDVALRERLRVHNSILPYYNG